MSPRRAGCLGLLLAAACADPDPVPGDVDDPGKDSTPGVDSDEPAETDCPDDDADGFLCDDCDDDDPAVFPGAFEACDGVDSDCDGAPHPGELGEGGVLACAACDDGGFWDDVVLAVDDDDLAARLATDTREFTRCDYGVARQHLFLDLHLEGDRVVGVYTGEAVAVDGSLPDPDVMNTEHSWPRSLGADRVPPECDLHHLFPTISEANNRRANHPFGEVVSGVEWSRGGSQLGRDAAGATVFEPRDVHKGTVARAMLYMALRYDWALEPEQRALFARWHAERPVDRAELVRTQGVGAIQGRPNPFVVCDGVVERVR